MHYEASILCTVRMGSFQPAPLLFRDMGREMHAASLFSFIVVFQRSHLEDSFLPSTQLKSWALATYSPSLLHDP